MNTSLEIAIIGGGPGGLTLARILQVKGFTKVKVYEQEESRYVRGQGGTLDLHTNTGQYALKVAGLFDQFQLHCRYEGEDLRVMDSTGVVHFEEINASSRGRPEIDRSQLRDILLDSIAEDTIIWGHSLRSIQQVDDGKLGLTFKNGKSATADFVVGADGTWSKVRPYLSQAKPSYTGINFMEITLRNVQPEVSDFVGRGTLFSAEKDKAIIAQRNSGAVIRVYAALKVSEDYFKNKIADISDIKAVKKFLLGHFESWDQKLKNLIELNEEEFIPRPIFALPVGHSWNHDGSQLTSKITILGDAVHVMSPFAGEGVNLAMMDATVLGLALASATKENLPGKVERFEKDMFKRSQSAAQMSADNLEMFFGPDGAIGMANKRKEFSSWSFMAKYMLGAAVDYVKSFFGR